MIVHGFLVYIRTENRNQVSFYLFVQHEISIFIDLMSVYLCYFLSDVTPRPNYPPGGVSYMVH